jgi:exodeoxyribonuclease V beta subunit
MSSLDESSLLNARSMMLNKYGFNLDEEEISDIMTRVKLFINTKEVAFLIDGKCYKEKALRYKNSLRYVDLLVQKDDGSFNVIDYKSSFAYSEHHLKQVRFYVKAISEITAKEVRGYICYLLADEIKIVPV